MDDIDPFIFNKVYTDPADIFATTVQPIKSIKNKCLFVLDTNALLLPYTTSSKSIEEIKKVYAKLIKEKRLFIPGQVAREFAKNRPEKIKELFQQLNRKRAGIQKLSKGQYPLLNGIADYDLSLKQEQEIDKLLDEYCKSIGRIIDHVKNWAWDDPVSLVYNKLFTESTIIDIKCDEEKIKNELSLRYLNKIPPGYEDDHKPDDGVGDLLIWHAILELAKSSKNDIIFVSGEEKTDWFHRSEKQPLYPRFELITEFRKNSDKHSFHIIKLSDLLEIFGADNTVVDELKTEEISFKRIIKNPYRMDVLAFKRITYNWVLKNYGQEYEILRIDKGFSDLTLTKNGEKKGVEIKFIGQAMFDLRLEDLFIKTYFEVNQNNYDSFLFIFICPTFEEATKSTGILERLRDKFTSLKMSFEIIIGTIDENTFKPVVHLK